ncbi:MAG TPA: hypothetical protein VN112_23540 [Ensifer sp.]|nr:hypothetical protein [Ensifer sp.]
MAVLLPVEAISKLTGLNRQAATVIVASISAFAAIAIISSFGIDAAGSYKTALTILGIGAAVVLAANIINDPMMQKIFGYTVTSCVCIFLIALVAAIVLDGRGVLPPAYCMIRPLERCQDVAAGLAEKNKAELEAKTDIPPVIETRSTTVDPSKYTVYTQFAGLITRESIIAFNKSLQAGGWKIPDVKGERLSQAAGLNEVRYRNDADRPAAQALADALTVSKMTSRPVGVAQLDVILPNKLEIWISN